LKIEIGQLGYGGGFDGWKTKIQLCQDCYNKTSSKWWELNIIRDECCEEYEYENEIFDYINSLPLGGQELVYNRFASGFHFNNQMEPQDWIDYKLNILPHEKCKKYSRYSPQERQAYRDRFPTCNYVYKRVYEDNSSGCWCHRNAHGNADGTCGGNISSQCYLCTDYEPKRGAMEVVYVLDGFVKRETQRLEEMINYATLKLELLKSDPKAYYNGKDKMWMMDGSEEDEENVG